MPIQRMQQRRGTSAEWAAANPILASGEYGYDTTIIGVKIGDGATAWADLPWLIRPSDDLFYRPKDYGAVGDGTTDDRVALQNTFDAAYDAGGGIVVIDDRYGWTGDLKHRGAITVTGVGKSKVPATDDGLDRGLVALDGTARYRYGQWAGEGPSTDDNPGSLTNLVIDGADVGGASELLLMECVDGSIQDCIIVRAAGNCVEVGGAQNTTVDRTLMGYADTGSALNFLHNPGQGAGNVKFNDCYFATSRYLITADSDPANFWPHDIFFNECLLENYTAGNDLVQLKAGDFQFTRTVFTNSNSGAPAPPNGCLVLISQTAWPTVSTTVVFDSCYFNGGTVDVANLVKIDSTGGVGNNVRFYGRNQFSQGVAAVGVQGFPPSLVSIEGTPLRLQNDVAWFAPIGAGTLGNVFSDTPTPARWTIPADGTLGDPIQIRREGDVTDRFRVSRDGTMRWLDGVTAGTALASLTWDSVNGALAPGGIWRFANGFARRGIIVTAAAPGTAAALSAAATAAPYYLINFTADGATANVTIADGAVGSELLIGLQGTGVNTVNWPSDVHFATGAPSVQPRSGQLVFVTLQQNLSGDWYEVSRSYHPEDDIDQTTSNRIATGTEVMPREQVDQNNTASVSQVLNLTMFTAYKTETVTQVKTFAGGTPAGATPTLARVGLYSVASNGDLTLLAATTNDTTLWSAANTSYTKALSASVTLIRGRRYAVGMLCVTAAAHPAWPCSLFSQAVANSLGSPRIAGQVAGQADLPASVLAASVAAASVRRYAELLP